MPAEKYYCYGSLSKTLSRKYKILEGRVAIVTSPFVCGLIYLGFILPSTGREGSTLATNILSTKSNLICNVRRQLFVIRFR